MFRTHTKDGERGFTLVEMIVSVGLFAIVMLVCVGALLSLAGANRKAQALQSVINNLNISLDGMVRAIRMGSTYNCDSDDGGDCANGGIAIFFQPFEGGTWYYVFDDDGTICDVGGVGGGRLCKSENNGTPFRVTAPEVNIESMQFYVIGSERGTADNAQPKVVITLKGTARAAQVRTTTSFSMQATAVQRVLDI